MYTQIRQEATSYALKAEKEASMAQQAAKEGNVDLAQKHAEAAKDWAKKAQQAAALAEKASLAHGNPPTKLN